MNLKQFNLTMLFLSILILAPMIQIALASDSSTFWISSGVYPSASSYTIWQEGSYYFAKNDYGKQPSWSGSTNATTVIHSSWDSMTYGGKIFVKGIINLGSIGLVFNIQKYATCLILEGEGETKTRFQYSGTGYAITLNMTGSLGYFFARLENFLINGGSSTYNNPSVTSGRNGLLIDNIGRTVVIDHVKIYNTDKAVSFTASVNEVYFYNTRIVTCNTGFYKPNSQTNELTCINCEVVNAKDYGFYLWGGNAFRMYGGLISTNGTGIFLQTSWTTNLDGVYFHHNNINYICDIWINGTNADTESVEQFNAKSCYFYGGNYADYAIKITHADSVKIDSPRSRNHNVSFIWLDNVEQELLIVNPNVEDPYLLDGSLTQTLSRIAGRVITSHAIGLIVVAGNNVTKGDVVISSTGGSGVVYQTTTANDDIPYVVTFDSKDANKPCVIALSGIASVNNASAVSIADTLVTHTTELTCVTNNSQTNPKKILGYVLGIEGTEVYIDVGA